ncbi:hypothetical protein, conserved [Eimeria maxima]|uniref:tRNA/rRNA methyltransferase SpoU type domain-containing protein n=1 Tax=Eimeria maxima TaxID=5804 RepID=U6M6G3_EIMMA|nr:hypothetical protein, conserved [Eimeria maxima]CDJ57270.1 hypothetical protein, conserved [Eimeria maxima]
MKSVTGEAPKRTPTTSNLPVLDNPNSREEIQTPRSWATKGGPLPIDAATHQERLEKRLQAQLRDGSRSRNVKRLEDPLSKHLLRVAGNPAYRNLRKSVIVTGKTLVCELLRNFPCRRLAVRRRSLEALHASLPFLHRYVDPVITSTTSASPDNNQLPTISKRDADSASAYPRLNTNVETHFVSNRILRKVAGFQSYDDGCVAEMRMPEPANDLGNIRLLLCLGNIPSSLGQTQKDRMPVVSRSNPEFLDSGVVGTLLRTAAALQWQGAWILPSCPDIFNPLAIRASQGALFWLPYRRGTVKELIQLCNDKDLAICVPHEGGIPVRTSGIFERKQKKGVCLVLDSSLISAAQQFHNSRRSVSASTGRVRSSGDAPAISNERKREGARAERCDFKPDILLSLGSDVAPTGRESSRKAFKRFVLVNARSKALSP